MSSASSSSSHDGSGSKPSGGWQPPTLEGMQAMLPQYRFECLLGRGGMGAVYKAVQASLDRPVAIKVLPGDLIDDTDAQFAERFKNEARTMAKMNHPSIVNVFDFGETQTGLLYIVMEFIDGTDVAKMIASQGRLPEDYALSITAHVCDALNYAHRNGVIHRDIKPANILINMDGAVKVADFGLAKQSDAGTGGLTKTNMAMGTPDFVAPEALIPGIPLDGRADLYAIGVMLYQMLTGEIPRGMWTMPGMKLGTDPRFDSIIAKAMQTDREVRYQSAADLRRDLDTILTTPRALTQPQPVAQPEPPAQTAQKPVAHAPRAPQGQKPAEKPVSATPPPKKSNTGLFIGLGAAAALLLGVWWLMRPAAPSPKTASPAPPVVSTPKPASSPPASPKPVPAPAQKPPQRAAIQTLDLLALTDPVKDRVSAPNLIVKNEWKREGGELVFQPDGKGGKLAPPVAFACTDYEIEFKAAKHSGNDRIHVDLPLKNGRILPLVLNGHGRKPINEREGTAWGTAEREVHVSIRVIDAPGSSDRIVIERLNVKGNPLADWSGDLDQHAKKAESHPDFPGQPLASVFVSKDKYAVQTFMLRVFEGEAKVLRAAASSETKPVAKPSQPGEGAIDLLASLDVKRAAIEGSWNFQGNALHGGGAEYARIAFDAPVPEEYDFHIQFTRTAGNNAVSQHIVLPGGRDAMWIMGGFGNTVSTWERVDGAPGNRNPTTVKMSLLNGRLYDCVVKVRKDRVQAEVDGKLISDHRITGVALDVFERWKFPDRAKLGVGCQTGVIFHRAELAPYSAKPVTVTTPVAPPPAVVPPMPAVAPVPSTPAVPSAAADPVSLKLADLESKFQIAFERDAGAAYKADLAKLNAGYASALDRELAAAAKAGKLDDAVALREEKQRIIEGKGLPPEDLDSLPESLKKLRGTWRGAEAGYAKQRDAKAAPLFDAYDRALDAFQTELTKQGKIDDALRVKTARDELTQRRGGSAAPTDEKTAPVKPTTPAPSASTAVEASSSWRKAAEWILGVGGEIRIRAGGTGNTAIKDAKDLPGGRFDITSIILNLPDGKGAQITDDDLTRFNGLRGIETVQLTHLPGVTGSGFAAFAASADSMKNFSVYDLPVQPQHMGFITQFKNLRLLELNNVHLLLPDSLAKIQVFKELTQLRLLGQSKLDDQALLQLAGLTKLTEINLPGAAITDEGLEALKGMKALTSLELSGIKKITGSGFVHLAGAKELARLKLFQTSVDDAALAHLSGLTNLRDLTLDQTAITDAGIRHLASLKALRTLSISATGVTGATLSQLSGCKELTSLGMFDRTNPSGSGLNDAGLQSLAAAGFPNLTELAIARASTTDAGLAHLSSMKLTKLYTSESPGADGLRHIVAISTLESLGLGRGALTDDGLAILAQLKALKTLIIDESQVTDAGLKALQGMSAVKTLTLKQSKATQAGFDALAKARPDLKVIK